MNVLVTGAAGNLGRKLVAHLTGRHALRRLDIDPRGDPAIVRADLSKWGDWVAHFDGVEAVVHLAADPVADRDWPDLVGPNVDAMLHAYEAASRAGVPRFVFASSNHVMGGYKDGPPVPLTTDLPPRPGAAYTAGGVARHSNAYAAAKLLGERVGKVVAQTRGMTVIAVRIGWVWRGDNTPAGLPPDRERWFHEMWLSDRDFCHLMECCLTAEVGGFVVVNGMSANTGMRWDIGATRRLLGYAPQDDVTR